MPLLSRRCSGCGTCYEVVEKRGVFVGMDRADDRPTCPRCDSEHFDALITTGQGILLGGAAGAGSTYPYFDNGLGCYVESDAHRRRICKERKLIPIDGDFDPVAEAARREDWAGQDRALAEHEQYLRDLEERPDFAGYRAARDRGLVQERFKPRATDEYWSNR